MTYVDVVRELALALGGVAVGYAVGRAEVASAHGKTRRQRWRDLASTVFALVVLSVVVYAFLADRARQECERQWFVSTAQALRHQSEARGEQIRAELAVLRASRDGVASERREAVDEAIASLERLERTRLTVPIPDPPRCD